MNPHCARCGKIVYATEKVNCLDKYWHKGCFHCEVCKMTLNMNNYKGYEKKPYCNAHYPKQTFTIVTDTPENRRLRQQSELQSQVKYRKDFEQSKGRGFKFVLDTPELQRLRKTQDQISNAKYHKDFEMSGLHGVSQEMRGTYLVQAQIKPNHETVGNSTHKGVHQYTMELDRRPGVIVESQTGLEQHGAPILPGAYHHSGHTHGHSYMHQTGMHSLRSMQLRSQHTNVTVYRALYDYIAQDYDEVSFRDGDVIQNVHPIDGGWMYGTVQRTGRSGMLPANYVEGIR
ncbi:LIM zinc-binding domain-containing Nebulette-like isoform X2 [Myxocyprinus asiaticus]|uniref:LIM zinc-binding domain-containing Nebulette-like isoform X2 n=1 Tax=Myxocyprinus asiaticus TaxID=70543 RepID=UPI00222138C1|nr:LIM zinc-binding domain-containing Nebulette-like isoform X2 [Myxocyprinus asiaticus]